MFINNASFNFIFIYLDTIHQMIKYILVLEYADSGTLSTYLSKQFNELEWNDKYC